MLRVDSYSIYHSSNAYLGVILAERALAGLPVELVRRPLCVPKQRGVWVADLVGGRANPRQGSYHREDCLRWAAKHRIEMRFPAPEELARRVAQWRSLPGAREELSARAYYGSLGSYVDLDDVNDEAVLRHAIEIAGLEPDALLERARDHESRRLLDAALADFDRLECPGVPTFVFEGERFWGKDRVDWIADAVRRRLAS